MRLSRLRRAVEIFIKNAFRVVEWSNDIGRFRVVTEGYRFSNGISKISEKRGREGNGVLDETRNRADGFGTVVRSEKRPSPPERGPKRRTATGRRIRERNVPDRDRDGDDVGREERLGSMDRW